jgi:hypothetical protein
LATCAKTAQRALLFAFLGLGACKSADGPDAVANAFVDAYYVEFDHLRAASMATGGAKRRIEEERKLVADARAQMQVETQKARVYYSDPAKRQVRDDMVHYTYQLDVRVSGAQRDQHVVVMLAKREEGWKVVQFREGDERAVRTTTSTTREP